MTIPDGLIADGGPSAPVWVMLLGIITLLINNIFKERAARQERAEAREEARKAAKQAEHAAIAAEQSVTNTKNISNGFARKVLSTQETILSAVQDIETRLTEHLAWHLNEEQGRRNASAREHWQEHDRQDGRHADHSGPEQGPS